MCHENPNVEAAMEEMESAAERLSMTQQNVNVPLFDLLFKLLNMPQTSGLAGSKLKVLHTYTHRFMEFYMTECPDGVSIHTINVNAIHEISGKLRAMGDGLGRLLAYLGLTAENEALMEYVDNLAVAYDAFAVIMAKVEDARDEFYDEDCDENCDCYRNCGSCDCGMCGACDEDNEEEDDDDDECDCEECSGACAQQEPVDKLFEKLFGRTPTDAISKGEPVKNEDNEIVEDLATMFTGFLSALTGDKKGMNAAADAAARLEKRVEEEKAQVKPAAEQPKKPTVKIRMTKAGENAGNAEELAKLFAKLLNVDVADCEIEYITPNDAAKARIAEHKKMQDEMNAAAKRAAQMIGHPMFREVMPGFWRFG